MSTTSEIRERAAQLIEERGWYQGHWRGADGSLCLDAALWLAAGVDPEPLVRMWPAVVRVAELEIASEVGILDLGARSLAHWNDHPRRTKDDVIAALRGVLSEIQS